MTKSSRTLTIKQKLFIEHYLQCWNATEAALKAGYSPASAHSIGSENLKKPEVSRAIETRILEISMSTNEVLLRLADLARGSFEDFIDVSSMTIDLQKASTKGKLHLIKKFKITTITKDDMQIDTAEIELYDKQAALVQLGRYHQLFTDRVKVDDWRSEAIADIRSGKITYEALAEAFGDESLATELFRAAGVPVQTG